jgi:hypothetical protein
MEGATITYTEFQDTLFDRFTEEADQPGQRGTAEPKALAEVVYPAAGEE